MTIEMTPEQRAVGRENYVRTSEGLSRRGFMKSLAIAGAAVVPASTAVYFGYEGMHGKPVKAALIGGGDEGGVLVGATNPDYMQFIAVCDIRPSNMTRIFDGDPKVPALRTGFIRKYGAKEAARIHKYTDYNEMLNKEDEIEAVVIAAPLFWHAKMAIDAMRVGQKRGRPIHVFSEKLMGWNIASCKKMCQVAQETNSILSVGHQRHYSMLYAHATEILKNGLLGDVKFIRALWHRNNAWPYLPNDKDKANLVKEVIQPFYKDGWFNPVFHEDYDALHDKIKNYGYNNVEELVRWRCHNETGGGLMAELGSHQLDACSIFLGHIQPIAVTGVGGKYFYGRRPSDGETNDYGFKTNYNDRDCDDHVSLTYEFPGKNHPRGPVNDKGKHGNDPNDIVLVTYSSINTNGFEGYGECVTGTRGTMIVEKEESVLLYAERNPNAKGPSDPRAITVRVDPAGAGKPALDSSSTWGPAVSSGIPGAGPVGGSAAPGAVISRGYKEELEDFAYCVREWKKDVPFDKQRQTRCSGEVALVDAVIALTGNQAMQKRQRIEFKDAWFDAHTTDVPDADTTPKIPVA